MSELSTRLRTLREKKKLTRKELSEFTGASQDQIYNWETGRGEPDSLSLSRLADHFSVTTDYLLGRVDSPTDSLVPATTEPLAPTIERANNPAMDEILDNLQLMSQDDVEAIRRITQSVVNRTTKDVG